MLIELAKMTLKWLKMAIIPHYLTKFDFEKGISIIISFYHYNQVIGWPKTICSQGPLISDPCPCNPRAMVMWLELSLCQQWNIQQGKA